MNYQHGKIYKLTNSSDGAVYVGSTTKPLVRRLQEHRSSAKYKLATPVYRHLNNVGWHRVSIELIEEWPCANRTELRQREQFHVNALGASLNTHSAYVHCPHGRRHNSCIDCDGRGICQHKRQRYQCVDCNDFSCIICDGRRFCNRVSLVAHLKTAKHMKRLYEEETAPMVEVPMVEVPVPMVEAPMVEVPMLEIPMVEVPAPMVPMPEEKMPIDPDTMSTEELWRVWHIVRRDLPKLQLQRL